MIKSFLHHLWEKNFLQYFIIGCSSFVLDIGTLMFLRGCLKFDPILAVAINQILTTNFVFFLNKYWSFKSSGQTLRQLVRFLILTACNYVFAIVWMWLFTVKFPHTLEIDFFGLKYDVWYLLVRVVNIALAISWNFLIYKYWVYKKVE